MCLAFDARPPDLPSGVAPPTLAGGAAAEALELTSADGTASRRRWPRPRRDGGPASSSSPTSAACTASTSSWPSASRRPATTRSSSITSGAPPARGSAATTGTTCPTSCRRAWSRSRPTPPPPSRPFASARARAHVTSASASAARSRSWRRRAPSSTSTAPWASTPVSSRGARGLRSRSARARDALPGAGALRRRRREHPPPSTSRPTSAALRAAGVEHEIVSYPGAPHSFFDRSFQRASRRPARTPGGACSDSYSRSERPWRDRRRGAFPSLTLLSHA